MARWADFRYHSAPAVVLRWEMQNFRNLVVWQRAQRLAVRVHMVTGQASGNGAWRSQLRRAAQSIGANIAEGAMRDSPKQFAHYLQIALGSASETESHLDFGARIGAVPAEDAMQLIDEVRQLQRMLSVLRRRVREAGQRSPRAGTND